MLERGLDPAQAPIADILHEVVEKAKYDDSEWVLLVEVLVTGGFSVDYQVWGSPVHGVRPQPSFGARLRRSDWDPPMHAESARLPDPPPQGL